ncbi:ferric reductase-like protein like transmembrane component [Saccharata proteae CBS 121410]|uniref:Ferric reductase-like protein like transmembrane component n=1 Tax=Saccharata proteae CBS 121410 TaxID=1314787 RepID=A0A9P4I269_9PEZI|nr:ferric reductase-like protein like transmembrane component [Saccharata proteae CBS 121410]
MLGFAFVSLSPEEKLARRNLLDFYASVAQWSVGILLIWLQFFFLARWAVGGFSRSEPPKSPHPKRLSLSFGQKARLHRLKQSWTRLCWWADEPVRNGCYTRGECFAAFVWTTWLLFLSVRRTGNDYLHLTKRLGIVGSSQLPLHYLLAMRSAYSPIQLLTHLPYERIVVLHQLLGKILTFIFVLHGVLYFNYFIQVGVLAKRLSELDVITGIVSLVIFAVMSTTALSIVRRWNYRVFYTTHVILALVVVDTLFFHVSHIRPYLWESLAVFILTQVFRQSRTRQMSGSVDIVPGTNLVRVVVPLPDEKGTVDFLPGQHIHMSRPMLSSKSAFGLGRSFLMRYRTNPFTIASIPAVDRELVLVARTLNGNTLHLADVARSLRGRSSSVSGSVRIPLTVEGPYGAVARLPDFVADYDQVLIVAGGVGATYAVPIWRALGGGVRGPLQDRVKLVWALRDLAETSWAFPHTSNSGRGVELFITGRRNDGLVAEGSEGMELAEGETLLHKCGDAHGDVNYGRPDLSSIVHRTFSAATGKVAVLVCGPESMTAELRQHVRRWVDKGREVFWHAEAFGL